MNRNTYNLIVASTLIFCTFINYDFTFFICSISKPIFFRTNFFIFSYKQCSNIFFFHNS